MLRIVDQRAGERDLHPLAGAEAFGAAVEQCTHVEQVRHRCQPHIELAA